MKQAAILIIQYKTVVTKRPRLAIVKIPEP